MIEAITISNFTVVNQLSMEIDSGFNVITGETGSGKSLLFDAIALCTGSRADAGRIRNGEESATISVTFLLESQPDAQNWIAEQGYSGDESTECVVRRVVNQNGRSKAFINGHPASLQDVKTLGALLVTLCGQHEHYSLLSSAEQRNILDRHGNLGPQLLDVRKSKEALDAALETLNDLKSKQQERQDRSQLVAYQLEELDEFAPEENEYKQLEAELNKLSNADDLRNEAYRSLYLLSEAEDHAILSNLSSIQRSISDMADTDSELKSVAEGLESALIDAQEATSELQRYHDGLELDPQRLAEVEARYSTFRDLARKHRCEPEELHVTHEELANEMASLNQSGEDLTRLENEVVALKANAITAANTLSKVRKKHGKSFAKYITEKMQSLGMEGGKCEFHIDYDEDKLSLSGADTVSLMVQSNPGEAMGSISKVVSGGELSRISLIIQLSLAAQRQAGTLLFDEVDVGISGKTAAVVGGMLKELGESAQVMSITHLPQVAACGNHHIVVRKDKKLDRTESAVQKLDSRGRIEAIAELLSSGTPDDTARKQAEKLLQNGI